MLYIKPKEKIKPENAFLIVGSVFCIFLYLAMPMTKAHDEPVHGLRIYEYKEGKIVNNGKSVTLPEGVIWTLRDKPFYKDLFQQKEIYNTQTQPVLYEYRMSTYSPISYFPHIVGVYTASFFTTNAMIQVYVARLFNMVTCIVLLYFAIKNIPYGKNVLFLLALIPIAVEGYISLSADGIAIASSFLFFSYTLKLKQEKENAIGYKQILFLTILAIVVAISKTVYLPIVLLLSIIPKEKFKKNKKWLVVSSIFMLALVIDFLWYCYGTQPIDSTQGKEIEISFSYVQKIVYTMVEKFSDYFNEIWGGKLEYNENVSIFVFPYVIFLAIVFMIQKGENYSFTKFEKLILSGIFLSIVFLIFTAMYQTWSRHDIAYIEGVQGRYFLPILPLGVLLFARGFSDDENTTKKVAMLISIMQIFVITKVFMFHV